MIFTDSNGREATADSIKRHMPREERYKYDIDICVAYTLEEAIRRVETRTVDVIGAKVIIDDLTNDVRGTRARPAVSPRELIRLVDQLRWKVMRAGAVGVVVCQVKPMQAMDVTPHNSLLNDYLRDEAKRGRGGHGCRTQITLDSLRPDGFHIKPQYSSVLDKTYACAMLGVNVPCPTPLNDFVPNHVRERREIEWPRLGLRDHGRRDGWS